MSIRLTILLLVICVAQTISLPFLFNLSGNNKGNEEIPSIFHTLKSQEQANLSFVKSLSRDLLGFLNNTAKNIKRILGINDKLPVTNNEDTTVTTTQTVTSRPTTTSMPTDVKPQNNDDVLETKENQKSDGKLESKNITVI